ncbi:MmgE/PrpD family protein [Paracoccus xiamenensis]|uniref:MmgE/PrpD family protein n=1 Tax=Paracoccus xiamenensis TaxID=2714901 RepID=UPI00140A393E|nr:MmgE/PrpD family protein [Paracoccus xiamenensis]NHF74636.1 MmgE/PrpD family protein [Paracoccus xiamenensis]
MTLADTLAGFATAPVAADARMRRFVDFSLADWATVGLAGQGEPVARAARQMALGDSAGRGGATVIGGGRAAPRAAALANGAISHALDYDDTHFLHIGHPSVAVIPAALSVAEAAGASGPQFLQALAVGLETACRMGAWLGRSHYEAGFHQTGTSGAFGATAAAGRLLGLDRAAMAQALALTATRAAGLKNQFGTMGKPLNAGFAAEIGVTCALLAQAGADSAPQAIEGTHGFGATHAGSAQADAFEGLGSEWVFPDISYKFHACCHGLHAMLEAVESLMPLDAGSVSRVQIRTHPRWLAVCNQPEPETGLQAKFSYRLTAAMRLAGVDTAALDAYSAGTAARPDLVALRDRVEVIGDSGLSDTQAVVVVDAGGDSLTVQHDLAVRLEPDLVEARLRAKSTTLLSADAADALWQAVEGLADRSDLAVFSGLIGRAL